MYMFHENEIEFDENKILTITEEIIEEEDEKDYQKLMKDSIIIKETMEDLNKILEDSGLTLLEVEENVQDTDNNLNSTNTQLVKANKYQKSAGIIKGTIIGGVIGLIFGGPIGGLLGWEIGSGLTAISALVGSVFGTVTVGGTTYGIMNDKKKKAEREYRRLKDKE